MAYRAWNGEVYEGDPPSGWFQAVDGRWWPNDHLDAPAPQAVDLDQPRPQDLRQARPEPRRRGRHELLPEEERVEGQSGFSLGGAPFENPAPRPAGQASAGQLPSGPFVPDAETMPIEDPDWRANRSRLRASDHADGRSPRYREPQDRPTDRRPPADSVNLWVAAIALTVFVALIVGFVLG